MIREDPSREKPDVFRGKGSRVAKHYVRPSGDEEVNAQCRYSTQTMGTRPPIYPREHGYTLS